MILITGASGQVGCSVIKALAKKGIETRAFIHNAENEENRMPQILPIRDLRETTKISNMSVSDGISGM